MRAVDPMGHGYSVIKFILWIFVLLSPLAYAETMPAQSYPAEVGYKSSWGATVYATAPQACAAEFGAGTFTSVNGSIGAECYSNGNYRGYIYNAHTCSGVMVATARGTPFACSPTCELNKGWTLAGDICTRPDCVAPQVRDVVNGECKAPPDPCLAKAGTSAGGGWITSNIGAEVTGVSCDGSCKVQTSFDVMGSNNYYTDGKTRTLLYAQDFTGESCSGVTKPLTTPTAKAPPEPPKKPPCLATEGVMTSSSGTVACVPEGAPGSNKPIVSKSKEVQNFPDGSVKTAETTTTRDPATGVESKSISVTVTAPTAGGTGAAGTPGTTTGTTETGTTTGGDPTKPGNSKFCADNPELQICKGGMSEEKTQKEIKDLLDPQEAANTESIAGEKNVFEEKATAHKEFIDAFASKGQSDEGFMSWAWIPEVPASSCTPFTGTVAGRAISMDWCEQLGMIRDVAGYMFYILTAFGLFRIFANSTGATS